MAGKLTLPNIKDCTNSKYDYLHVLFFWFARKWEMCAHVCVDMEAKGCGNVSAGASVCLDSPSAPNIFFLIS